MTPPRFRFMAWIPWVATIIVLILVCAGVIGLLVNNYGANSPSHGPGVDKPAMSTQPPAPIPAPPDPESGAPPMPPNPPSEVQTSNGLDTAPLPQFHMPDGQVFEPAICNSCNTFGFLASDQEGRLVSGTRQFAGQQADGGWLYSRPSPYVLLDARGSRPSLTQGQDEQGRFSIYAWYTGYGVEVKHAVFEVNAGDISTRRNAFIAPALAGSPAGAATVVWFKIYPDEEVLVTAWFAAIVGQALSPPLVK